MRVSTVRKQIPYNLRAKYISFSRLDMEIRKQPCYSSCTLKLVYIDMIIAQRKGGLMKETLKPGLDFEFAYQVPENKTVPHLYPEASDFLVMPKVFATGFMVGLIEWACIQFLTPHLDWPNEQSVGIGINVNHTAATPPGMTVTVKGTLDAVEGKKLTFSISAHDGMDQITKGIHERFVIDAAKFNGKLNEKISKAGV